MPGAAANPHSHPSLLTPDTPRMGSRGSRGGLEIKMLLESLIRSSSFVTPDAVLEIVPCAADGFPSLWFPGSGAQRGSRAVPAEQDPLHRRIPKC